MAVEGNKPYVKYDGNGVTTLFPITYEYIEESDIEVYVLRSGSLVQKKLGKNDYSFENETTIKFPAVTSTEPVLGNGDILNIVRETDIESDFIFPNQQRLYPQSVQQYDDREMMILQELKYATDRSVKVSETSSVSPDEYTQELFSGIESALEAASEAASSALEAGAIRDETAAIVDGFDTNVQEKTNTFNTNASEKTTAFNSNASDKTSAFDLNATNKTNLFNQNAADKTSTFDANADEKTSDFNDNATEKTNAFDSNYTEKTDAFNSNATTKTNEFNANAAEKQETINASVSSAAASSQTSIAAASTATTKANNAMTWAEGSDSEVSALGGEKSAKGWAETAQSVAQLSDASEAVKGIIQIATNDEADAGINNEKAMTPAKVSRVVSDSIGRGLVLGFDGTLSGTTLTFEPSDGTPYDLKNNYDYEIDLFFQAVGELPDTTTFVIKNGSETIPIRNTLSGSMNADYGDMRQLCKYDTDFGWRWIFQARYKENYDDKAFVIPAVAVAVRNNLENPNDTTIPSTKAVSDSIEQAVPSQTGNSGKFLTTNGTTTSWENALSYDTISNCILENPKLVDVSLSNGTLTAAAGSTAIVPYGREAPTMSIGQSLNGGTITDISWDGKNLFYYVTYNSDKTLTTSVNGDRFVFQLGGRLSFNAPEQVYSGPTFPSAGQVFYNTAENFFYSSGDFGQTWNKNTAYSFPFCIIENESGIKNIKQVIDSIGYFGSTIWYGKGLKVLTPNGRNSDGSLNNSIFTENRVAIYTITSSSTSTIFCTLGQETDNYFPYYEQTNQPTTSGLWYNPNTNLLLRSTNGGNTWVQRNSTLVLVADLINGKFSNFKFRDTFRVADYYEVKKDISDINDSLTQKANLDLSNVNATGKSNAVNWGMPNYSSAISITSGYVAPTDGFIKINMGADNNTNNVLVNNVNVFVISASGASAISVGCFIPVSANDTIVFTGSSAVFFPAKGV